MQERTNENFVLELAETARQTISEGYYQVDRLPELDLPRRSLRSSIVACKRSPAVITELKFRSPAEGSLRAHEGDEIVRSIARGYERGGAVGISVLTEPRHFEGRLDDLGEVKRSVSLPVLMKDIIIDRPQIDAAKRIGADAILIMVSIFTNGLSRLTLDEMIEYAHSRGLEALLEAHTREEYAIARESQADLLGINNRDLGTLEVSLDTSRDLLKEYRASKPVICESGISTRQQILELHALGADGFLIGSAIMKSRDVEESVRALTGVW